MKSLGTIALILGMAVLFGGYLVNDKMTEYSASYDDTKRQETLKKALNEEKGSAEMRYHLEKEAYLKRMMRMKDEAHATLDYKEMKYVDRQLEYNGYCYDAEAASRQREEERMRKWQNRQTSQQTRKTETETEFDWGDSGKNKNTTFFQQEEGDDPTDYDFLRVQSYHHEHNETDERIFNYKTYYFVLLPSIYDHYKRYKLIEIDHFDAEDNKTEYFFHYREDDKSFADMVDRVTVVRNGEEQFVIDVLARKPINKKLSSGRRFEYNTNEEKQLVSMYDISSGTRVNTQFYYTEAGYLSKTMSFVYKNGNLMKNILNIYVADDDGYVVYDEAFEYNGDQYIPEDFNPLKDEPAKTANVWKRADEMWIKKDPNLNFDISRLLIAHPNPMISVLCSLGSCGKFIKGVPTHYKDLEFEYKMNSSGHIGQINVTKNGEYYGKFQIVYWGGSDYFPKYLEEDMPKSHLF